MNLQSSADRQPSAGWDLSSWVGRNPFTAVMTIGSGVALFFIGLLLEVPLGEPASASTGPAVADCLAA